MHYRELESALDAMRWRGGEIAEISAQVADRVTAIAVLTSLVAALLFAGALARERQNEQVRTMAISESRFRGLVQHSSDLILVMEPHGTIRYATPSAQALMTESYGSSAGERGGQNWPNHAGAKALHVEQLLGLSVPELLQRERNEVELRDANGRPCIYEFRVTDLTDHADIGGIVINGRDITAAKAAEERLRHQATHDPVTGLPNRRQFVACYEAMTAEQRRAHCVMFLDLDGFKLVNDSHGHSVGDQLLVHTAARIGSCLNETDLLVRQGGDEFIIVCTDAAVAERIQAALVAPFELAAGVIQPDQPGALVSEVFVSASIGVVTDLQDINAEQAAQRADIAMYKAKEAGKGRAIVFSDEMLRGAPERLALDADFRRALERRELTVVYQPKVGLISGVTESLEALVRWKHPTRGLICPNEFVPFAEESGLVDELGRQVLAQACRDAVRWQAFNLVVAVNLSPLQFRNPRLVDEVREALEQSGLDAKYLELEITESAMLGDVANTARVMRDLKALGIRLAIDAFGTGYSNLAHLKHFNADVLKIDQAFVRGNNVASAEHLSDGAVVEAVIGLARAFDMHVVAEGVESETHAAELRILGADLGQGYFFSRPVCGEDIDDYLSAEVANGLRGRAVLVPV